MPNINNGLLDGVRRIGARFRDITIDGGLPGVPLGFRIRGATKAGAPVTGTWRAGDEVRDRNGITWTCTTAGTPGTWSSSVNTTSSQTITGAKVFQYPSGEQLVISSDGTTTSGGAIVLNPQNENLGFISIYSSTFANPAYFVPDILTSHWAPSFGAVSAQGFGVLGATANSGDVCFAVQNFSQFTPGLGAGTFTCLDNNTVTTFNNTLDNGSGGATFTGAVNVNGGVADSEQFTCLATSYTLTNSTSAQKLFNASTNGAFTAAASTSYFIDAEFDITGLSASSHTISFGFGGTATYTSVKYIANVLTPFTAGTFASWPSSIFTSATAQTIAAAGTNTSLAARIRGIIRVNGAGTVIPQITQGSNAAAAVVSANSWIRFTPVGSNTVADVGSWS